MMQIRDIRKSDAARLAEIYNYYVSNTVFTFDESPCEADFFETKIDRLEGIYPFICADDEGEVLGYAYASPFREKPAYRHTVETSIYLDYHAAGRGLGTELYAELLNRLKTAGYKTVIAVLGLPNKASENLHKKFGFAPAITLNKVGRKFGKWLDTGYWQLDLDKYTG